MASKFTYRLGPDGRLINPTATPREWAQRGARIRRGMKQHADCTRAKAIFVAAEVKAHVELARHGRTRAYRAAERASEQAFAAARQRGCRWAR